MADYIICGLCGFRGLEIGSTMCVLCNNEGGKKNKKARTYIENVNEPPKDTKMEEGAVGLYEKYECTINNKLPKHPTQLMESSLLAAIPLSLKDESILHSEGVLKTKSVSVIQGETIMMILNKFNTYYQDGNTRCGFYLGDGTGCGKGRVISGVIEELRLSYNQTKAVWFSVSQDLEVDSQRDIDDVKCKMSTMNLLNKTYNDTGVMFSTYNTIVKTKRYCDLCNWLGDDFEGLIVFDESHKAKQCLDNNKSKTAQKIIDLQCKYPKARVLYVSATGCSQVEHMGYMIRLNLWGNNTLHKEFKEFVDVTNGGGDFANEMVAMYLKRSGSYIARSLSYKRVTTGVTMIKTSEFEDIYNKSIVLIDKIRHSGFIEGKTKMMFGSAMLRFFRSMLMTFKMEKTIGMIQQCLSDNMSVVVTIQSTWETHQSENVDEFDAPKMTLIKFLEFIQDSNEDEKVQELCEELVDDINKMRLGGKLNVIDAIINHFGEDNVAEITGRKKYTSGTMGLVNRELSNIQEKDLFVEDKKRVCVISEAGSVGISLHDVTGKHRRFHLILELPWSAEQFMQQCGRTHRSGQLSAPHYQIIMTELPSESRFLSIILKRLRTLGALTNGNRFIKTDMFELGQDYESSEGNIAVISVLEAGLSASVAEVFDHKPGGKYRVSKFFNRMMMLKVGTQQTVFEMFHKEYTKCCNDVSRRNGKHHINEVLVTSMKNERVEQVTESVSITKIDVASKPRDYDSVFENVKGNNMLWLVKGNNRSLAIAIQLNKQSDLYKLYQPSSVKETIVTQTYINSEFKKYTTSDFIQNWDNQVQKNLKTETLLLVTGNLYEIRMIFNKHSGVKNARMKKVTCDNKSIMGFHISTKMETIIKQIVN